MKIFVFFVRHLGNAIFFVRVEKLSFKEIEYVSKMANAFSAHIFEEVKHSAIKSVSLAAGNIFNSIIRAAKETNIGLISRTAGKIEKFIKSDDFTELPAQKLSKILFGRSLGFISFLHDHCMRSMEESDNTTGIMKLEDGPVGEYKSIFVARCEYVSLMTVEKAKNCGFILPDNISELIKKNPKLKIRPLMIRCYGVSSSNTLTQLGIALGNGLGVCQDIVKDYLANAVNLVETFIKEERAKNFHKKDELIVPFITGFSLGGMFASAIALKLHYGSAIFNPLGLGQSGCEFVGKDNWKLATTAHKNKHLAFCTEYDFVSSNSFLIRYLVKIPGQIVNMKNIGIGGGIHPAETHTHYRDVFAEIIRRKNHKCTLKVHSRAPGIHREKI